MEDEGKDETSLTADRFEDAQELRDSEIRYWSDYNRVYYIPRTVQKVPDSVDLERAEGDWDLGQQSFARYNEVLLWISYKSCAAHTIE